MKKPSTIADVIRRATARELVKMEDEVDHLISHWTGEALASWIAPGIIRSVTRHLTTPKRKKARR